MEGNVKNKPKHRNPVALFVRQAHQRIVPDKRKPGRATANHEWKKYG